METSREQATRLKQEEQAEAIKDRRDAHLQDLQTLINPEHRDATVEMMKDAAMRVLWLYCRDCRIKAAELNTGNSRTFTNLGLYDMAITLEADLEDADFDAFCAMKKHFRELARLAEAEPAK